jgi:hypothetical protein
MPIYIMKTFLGFYSNTHCASLINLIIKLYAEYGLGKHASTEGDVYSFGVLLLEIVTGRRPTDLLIHEASSLHELVKSHYPYKLEPIVEEALDRCSPSAMPRHCNTPSPLRLGLSLFFFYNKIFAKIHKVYQST